MEGNENKKGKENKNENKEETIVVNNDNKKKYIIPILIIVIIVLIGGICYLHMNIVSKDKNIADKEKIIKQQKEELLNISKDKENEKKKEKEKQTTKPNEQQKETKYLSKEEYLKIFKKFVGTDFPGDYSKENEYNKKRNRFSNYNNSLCYSFYMVDSFNMDARNCFSGTIFPYVIIS